MEVCPTGDFREVSGTNRSTGAFTSIFKAKDGHIAAPLSNIGWLANQTGILDSLGCS
jgi:hypothetical protein